MSVSKWYPEINRKIFLGLLEKLAEACRPRSRPYGT